MPGFRFSLRSMYARYTAGAILLVLAIGFLNLRHIWLEMMTWRLNYRMNIDIEIWADFRPHLKLEVIIWGLPWEQTSDVSESIVDVFYLPNDSIKIYHLESLNRLNGEYGSSFSPNMTFVTFLFKNNTNTSRLLDRMLEHVKEGSLNELYSSYEKTHGKGFVMTLWGEPVFELTPSIGLRKRSRICPLINKMYLCGGLNNNLLSMMSGVAFAYFSGRTFLAPPTPIREEMCLEGRLCEYAESIWWFEKTADFSWLWDFDHLKRHLDWLGVMAVKDIVVSRRCKTHRDRYSNFTGKQIQTKRLYYSSEDIVQNFSSCPWNGKCWVTEYDCMFGAFSPKATFQWGLWTFIRNSFRFSPEILKTANKILDDLKGNYTSFHLRIEDDVKLDWAAENNWRSFFEALPIRFNNMGIPKEEEVLIVTGLDKNDFRVAGVRKSLRD